MDPASMDRVFHALSHASRRRMLDLLKGMPGCSVADVAKYFETSRVAVLKHLRVLEEAGLIVSTKRGRARELHLNTVPIQEIHDRWASEYGRFWASRVTDLKYAIESRTRRRG